MANTTIYHYRVYPKENREIVISDFQLLRKYLFDEPLKLNLTPDSDESFWVSGDKISKFKNG